MLRVTVSSILDTLRLRLLTYAVCAKPKKTMHSPTFVLYLIPSRCDFYYISL
ncbi:hypothetical protein COCVIDRAFT_110501 [Bipolaris victoriae FI3]|uniref:Uncharacterized protein n=2 Tax=Bipolaris TaxID=33194 RepID=W6YC03_COCC2|nr:uncharacterized protein COCCADRAFT_97017 [Bipolaris zeicola 26-R-13]XP_014552363.1 hypothetical protein COCVIDRAFT_110501 [Bipolaris victoriae FI3]EUC33059.1 hypothetical protein COCCADRAFT_97017 [Bipolaris zeicola 26-R-13]